jgi:hypothetical protein
VIRAGDCAVRNERWLKPSPLAQDIVGQVHAARFQNVALDSLQHYKRPVVPFAPSLVQFIDLCATGRAAARRSVPGPSRPVANGP